MSWCTTTKAQPRFFADNTSTHDSSTTPKFESHRPHVVLEVLPLDLPAQVSNVHLRAGGASHSAPVPPAVSPFLPHEDWTAHELGLAELIDRIPRLCDDAGHANKMFGGRADKEQRVSLISLPPFRFRAVYTLVGDYGRRDQIFDAIPPAVCARTGALPRNGTYPQKSERLRRPAVVKRCARPSHHTNPVNNGYHCPKRVSWLASMGPDKATDGDGAVPTLNRLTNKHTLSENLGIDSLKTTTTENITAYAQKATARRRQIRHHDDLGITGVHTRECAHLL